MSIFSSPQSVPSSEKVGENSQNHACYFHKLFSGIDINVTFKREEKGKEKWLGSKMKLSEMLKYWAICVTQQLKREQLVAHFISDKIHLFFHFL